MQSPQPCRLGAFARALANLYQAAFSRTSFPRRFLNCGGIIGYAEDLAFYIAKYFWQSGRVHDAFKDQRFWTDMFLAQSLRTGTATHTYVDIHHCVSTPV